MFVACGIRCFIADVLSVDPSLEQSDEGLTLETSAKHLTSQATNIPYQHSDKHTISAKHHIPQATNLPYQPLLIKPIYRK